MRYIAPTLIIDLCLFTLDDKGKLKVLLIERANEPYKGYLALPGGYVSAGETTREALKKKISLKTGLNVDDFKLLEQLYTFDTIGRDPRGDSVSVCWFALSNMLDLKSFSGENPQFIDLKNLPQLQFDHNEIINLALSRLRDKIWYSNILSTLLPNTFKKEELLDLYKLIDDTTTEEELNKFIEDNDLLKDLGDGIYKFKIKDLIYFKK